MRAQELLPFWDASDPGVPVFCLPHAGGGASAYRAFARELRPTVNIQPVQLPGREGSPHRLVDDAVELVELIGTALEPLLDRPFALAGHSMGAMLAAELTAWLARRGAPLPRLLVLSGHTGDFRYDRMTARELTDDELVAELTLLGGTTSIVLTDPELRQIVLEILRNDLRLIRKHRPNREPLDVPILAVGGDADPEVPLAGLAAWQDRTTRSCRVEALPGGHFALLHNTATMARLIAEGLRDPADVLLDILRTRLDDPELTLDDDFYAAGGDSVVALGVLADVRERGMTIDLRDLLTSADIREMAERVRPADEAAGTLPPFGDLADEDRALVPAGVVDAYPASALQVGLIYLCELAGDPSLYNDMAGVRVRAPFRADAFHAALATVVRRHPNLRASFDLAGYSTAVQLVWGSAEPSVQIESGDGDALVRAFRERQLATGVDWSTAPAFACHVAVEPDGFRLTVAIHHAIIDGWSFARLMVELITCYAAELAGKSAEAELPPVPPDGHRRFVALERASSASAAFWRAEADVPPLLVPDRPNGTVPDPVAARHLPIDPPTLAGLRAAAEEYGVPLKSVFLAAHGASLATATGRDTDVVTGMVTNGRPEIPGSDHLLGLFLNTVPVRLRSTTGTWAEQARSAWQAEQNLLAHRRYPLAEIERDLGRPAFDVSMNFTHFHTYRHLAEVDMVVDSWWSYDKASFPFGVDIMIDAPDLGTGVVAAFDPTVVPADVVDRYMDALTHALASIAARLPEAAPLPIAGA